MNTDNETRKFDCSRGCVVERTDEGELKCDYRQGCCKLEVYDWLPGVKQEQYRDYFEVRFKNTRKGIYVNASGQNMDKAVDEAMGGVLFIDEAYNLLPQPGSTNNTGNEALDALMTRMENDKGKFVVVIAGYKDRMEELIRRGNPGLMSRFNKTFHIDDYSAEALTEIFKMNARKRKFTLTPDAEKALSQRMQDMVAGKGLHFGNAREAVNLLNEVIEMQGNRIASDTSIIDINPDALTTIEAVDIPQI